MVFLEQEQIEPNIDSRIHTYCEQISHDLPAFESIIGIMEEDAANYNLTPTDFLNYFRSAVCFGLPISEEEIENEIKLLKI